MDSLPEPFFLDHPSITFSPAGELTLAGVPASELVERFGSPLVVLLEDVIRQNCRDYRRRFEIYPRSRIYYASKAFLTVGMCKLLQQEGLGLDVVSAGELYTAQAADFPPADILLHGNAKTQAELELAVKMGVGRIVIDSFNDIARLAELANRFLKTLRVHLRVTPGVKPSTHEYIQTGQVDSKFGFGLDGAAQEAARVILNTDGLELVGLHCHIGSQIYELGAFEAAARIMLEFYAHLQKGLGAPLDELNLGGGLGIRYQPGDEAPAVETHLDRLTSAVRTCCAEFGLELPVLCDEPGRSIVGEAGVTLYTVQSVKRIPGVRNYVGLDGGMTDNPRFALYGARHFAINALHADAPTDELWTLAGKCCETGDMLLRDAPLAEPQLSDVLAMFSTGAYTYSMASNYNRVPRPAVVLAGSSGVGLLARRETPEDLIRLDEVPQWLG
jgi:diaminopimelate decarboxylase